MSKELREGESLALIRNALFACRLFTHSATESLEKLALHCTLRRYCRGASVSTTAGPARQALLSVAGLLEINRLTANGRRFVMHIAGPGDFIGLAGLFGDPLVKVDYVARENLAVIHMPCIELRRLFDAEPPLWRDVCRFVVNQEGESLGALLDQVVLGGADQRIAAILGKLSLRFGTEREAGRLLKLRLSQDDIADMLCVSRQTVNKELHRLETLGVVRCSYNTITILKPDRLSELVH